MSTFGIDFAVTCETNYGQRVCICGNLPSLGQWNPLKGVILQTDNKSYPRWSTTAPVPIKQGLQIEFKLCVLNGAGGVVRWEQIVGNRVIVPKKSLIIEFDDSDPSIKFKMPRLRSSRIIKVQNCRKGTEDVMDSWGGSDSSSNRDMWPKNEQLDEEQGSLLLAQFNNQLTRLVASQREQSFSHSQLQPEMQQHEMDFGAIANHYYHTHYVLSSQLSQTYERLISKYSKDETIFLRRDYLPHLQLNHKQEVSLFHLLDWHQKQDIVQYAKLIVHHWRRAAANSIRGLLIIYLQTDTSTQKLEQLLAAGVNVLVVNTVESVNNALCVFSKLKYKIFCSNKPDVFVARQGLGKQIKLVFTPFNKKNLVNNFEEEVEELKQKLLDHYYFSFESKQFQNKLDQKLSLWKMNKGQCLIILQVWRMEDIQSRTISDLIHLSSQRFRVIVFIIVHERFPRNIQHKIPVAKHKVIFINTLGDLYTNTGQSIDLFYFLQINKATFESNQNLVLEQLGSGINKYYWKNNSLIIDFPENTLGDILRKRALKLVQDVNRKSIAKLVVQSNATSLELIPFFLHLSFFYKAILTTFALRLNRYQKGTVINIDGTNLSALRYLQAPEGPECCLRFLRFCLQKREGRGSYACNPMSDWQLQKMIQLISDDEQSEKTSRQGEVLMQIKNIR